MKTMVSIFTTSGQLLTSKVRPTILNIRIAFHKVFKLAWIRTTCCFSRNTRIEEHIFSHLWSRSKFDHGSLGFNSLSVGVFWAANSLVVVVVVGGDSPPLPSTKLLNLFLIQTPHPRRPTKLLDPLLIQKPHLLRYTELLNQLSIQNPSPCNLSTQWTYSW